MADHWDEATFQATLAQFLEKPTPTTALALAGQGDERALPALVDAARDLMEGTDSLDYEEALLRLGRPDLLARWLTGSVEQRRTAAQVLSARLAEHVPLLSQALQDPDDQVRAIARRALTSFVRSEPLRQLFLSLLAYSDVRIRLLAAEGLGKIGKGEDVPSLQGALALESDEKARHVLEQSLVRLGG
jgi:HEAT repeat protein